MRNISWQRLGGRGLSLPLAVLLLALVFIGTALAVNPQSAPQIVAGDDQKARKRKVILNAIIDMTCLPTMIPGPNEPIVLDQPPPCEGPGLEDAYSSSTPSGQAHLIVRDDDTVQLDIKLKGIAAGQTVTAWFIWYFQFRLPEVPHPIFASIDPAKDLFGVPFAVAAHSVPLAPTHAGYTEGLGPEPNQIFINQAGNGRLTAKLDYNPLKPHQGPLRNGLVSTHQGAAPADSIAAQPGCCPGIAFQPPFTAPQPVGSSFLREFDPATGFQVLEANGRPKLVRSPVPAAFISIISSLDKHTKGMNPGLPHIPEVGVIGDHVVLGVFDLRTFHLPGE